MSAVEFTPTAEVWCAGRAVLVGLLTHSPIDSRHGVVAQLHLEAIAPQELLSVGPREWEKRHEIDS